MDAGDIALVAVGALGTIAILWTGFRLDRRSQRIRSAQWMRSWSILARVRSELFNRLHGPLWLQDQRSAAAPPGKKKRKLATPRRKRPRKPSR